MVTDHKWSDLNPVVLAKKDAMIVTLNGEKKEVPDDITVLGLLEFLKIQNQRVAVELNLEIVKKDKYDATVLKEDDGLEVVSFMAGGGSNAECGLRIAE